MEDGSYYQFVPIEQGGVTPVAVDVSKFAGEGRVNSTISEMTHKTIEA